MRLKIYFRLLNRNITVITNSNILKNFIENGFAITFSKHPYNVNRTFKLILKNPYSYKEAFDKTLKLIERILINTHDNYFIFHGSAFSFNGKTTLILGDSGSGKSSICFWAGINGAEILGDEPILINKKSLKVVPFRYLIKISHFYKIFSGYNIFKKLNVESKRIIDKFDDYCLFTKEELEKLKINFKKSPLPLKKIIFLEEKRYDSLLHLIKHCIFPTKKLLKPLNNFIKDKDIVFAPQIISNIKDKYKKKEVLKLLK